MCLSLSGEWKFGGEYSYNKVFIAGHPFSSYTSHLNCLRMGLW